ncbi:unnamed protein product [Cyprideis torosa]|uniref:Uncharacterized protein n=1 Tax=Cyprideis torosa TaxID=163714 RepID=A0A7R8ZRM5_9CRUS|nr:unnamed protein product [Cyprideis torosa]CAG0894361.1 unnamed protein product [Cyprideis torosa]
MVDLELYNTCLLIESNPVYVAASESPGCSEVQAVVVLGNPGGEALDGLVTHDEAGRFRSRCMMFQIFVQTIAILSLHLVMNQNFYQRKNERSSDWYKMDTPFSPDLLLPWLAPLVKAALYDRTVCLGKSRITSVWCTKIRDHLKREHFEDLAGQCDCFAISFPYAWNKDWILTFEFDAHARKRPPIIIYPGSHPTVSENEEDEALDKWDPSSLTSFRDLLEVLLRSHRQHHLKQLEDSRGPDAASQSIEAYKELAKVVERDHIDVFVNPAVTEPVQIFAWNYPNLDALSPLTLSPDRFGPHFVGVVGTFPSELYHPDSQWTMSVVQSKGVIELASIAFPGSRSGLVIPPELEANDTLATILTSVMESIEKEVDYYGFWKNYQRKCTHVLIAFFPKNVFDSDPAHYEYVTLGFEEVLRETKICGVIHLEFAEPSEAQQARYGDSLKVIWRSSCDGGENWIEKLQFVKRADAFKKNWELNLIRVLSFPLFVMLPRRRPKRAAATAEARARKMGQAGAVAVAEVTAPTVRARKMAETETKARKMGLAEAAAETKARKMGQAEAAAETKARKMGQAEAAAETKARKMGQAEAAAETKARKMGQAEAAAETKARKVGQAEAAAEAKARKMGQAQAAAETKARKVGQAEAAAEAKARKMGQAEAAAETKARKVGQAEVAAEAKARKMGQADAEAEMGAQARKRGRPRKNPAPKEGTPKKKIEPTATASGSSRAASSPIPAEGKSRALRSSEDPIVPLTPPPPLAFSSRKGRQQLQKTPPASLAPPPMLSSSALQRMSAGVKSEAKSAPETSRQVVAGVKPQRKRIHKESSPGPSSQGEVPSSESSGRASPPLSIASSTSSTSTRASSVRKRATTKQKAASPLPPPTRGGGSGRVSPASSSSSSKKGAPKRQGTAGGSAPGSSVGSRAHSTSPPPPATKKMKLLPSKNVSPDSGKEDLGPTVLRRDRTHSAFLARERRRRITMCLNQLRQRSLAEDSVSPGSPGASFPRRLLGAGTAASSWRSPHGSLWPPPSSPKRRQRRRKKRTGSEDTSDESVTEAFPIFGRGGPSVKRKTTASSTQATSVPPASMTRDEQYKYYEEEYPTELAHLNLKYKLERYREMKSILASIQTHKWTLRSRMNDLVAQLPYTEIGLDLTDDVLLRLHICTPNHEHQKVNRRPRNMFTLHGLQELTEILLGSIEMPDIPLVMVCGHGMEAFCLGVDWSSLLSEDGDEPTIAEIKKVVVAIRNLLTILILYPKPVVAVVSGEVAGLGAALLPCFSTVHIRDGSIIRLPKSETTGLQELLEPPFVKEIKVRSSAEIERQDPSRPYLSAEELRRMGVASRVISTAAEGSFVSHSLSVCKELSRVDGKLASRERGDSEVLTVEKWFLTGAKLAPYFQPRSALPAEIFPTRRCGGGERKLNGVEEALGSIN